MITLSKSKLLKFAELSELQIDGRSEFAYTNRLEHFAELVLSDLDVCMEHVPENEEPRQQLAAEQLNNKRLREALEFLNARIVTMDLGGVVERALSIPASTEALDKYVAEKVNNIESCRDWYKRRIDLLQEWQSKMRDPERTIVCDIIANGLTMPEGGRYEIGKSDLSTITKQRYLAVEALKSCGVNDGLNGPTQYFDEDLVERAIKESEAK